MPEIKLTKEQIKEINELYTNMNEGLYSLGLLTYNLSQLENEIKQLKLDKNTLEEQISKYGIIEKDLIKRYQDLHGEFEFDLINEQIIIK